MHASSRDWICELLALSRASNLFVARSYTYSGVGEDSTFIALLEPTPPVPNMARMWVSPNGIVAAVDPQFVANFGWRATEVNGSNLTALMMVQATDSMAAGDGRKGGDEEVAIANTVTESASDTVKR